MSLDYEAQKHQSENDPSEATRRTIMNGAKGPSFSAAFATQMRGGEEAANQVSVVECHANQTSSHNLQAMAPVVEDTISIEERRKRREAIKAKYKDQPTPLLVQAVQHGDHADSPTTSRPISTANSSRSGEFFQPVLLETTNNAATGSPSPSPVTTLPGSRQESPPLVEVLNDADLANKTDLTADDSELTAAAPRTDQDDPAEPSAADYDPTMDMQEDRKLGNQRQQGAMSTTDSEETKPSEIQIPIDETDNPQPLPHQSTDDMFASDNEDDDMFADAPSKVQSTAAAPQAKKLDESLLDNWDDPEGYYRIILKELLDGRYIVQSNLGKGMFSSVIRATDTQTNGLVAIKVIRNNESMLKAAFKEMEILEKLGNCRPRRQKTPRPTGTIVQS